MKNRIIKELLYMGLDREQLSQVREAIAEDNRKSIVTWSVCSALFWVMSLVLSLNSSAYAACRIVYAAALLSNIITMVEAQFFAKRFPRLLSPLMYLYELTLLCAGIGIAIYQPDVRTASAIAFAIIAPTAMIDATISDLIMFSGMIAAYVVFGKGVIEPEIYSWGLTNLIIFSIAGNIIGHIINKARFERYVYAESVKKLAEIQTRYAYYDQMTGLKNRRAYVEKIDELAQKMPDNVCVVMADLNGLKQANDTFGHDTGDALIKGAAECLRAAFENNDNIFRIGGDEFCVIMTDTAETAALALKRLETITSQWKGPHIDGISIACGLAAGQKGADITRLTTQADQEMYEQKRAYHLKTGT